MNNRILPLLLMAAAGAATGARQVMTLEPPTPTAKWEGSARATRYAKRTTYASQPKRRKQLRRRYPHGF